MKIFTLEYIILFIYIICLFIYLFVYFIYLFYLFIYLFFFLYFIIHLFIYITYYTQFSSCQKVTITLLNISLLSLPPPFPNTRCIAYNFDGSNVNKNDFSMLRYEDGGEILNINDYLKKNWKFLFYLIYLTYNNKKIKIFVDMRNKYLFIYLFIWIEKEWKKF
jgi:hypothetical protein